MVLASSPSNALKYLICCSKSVAPNSFLSNISNPTLLSFGIPRAAMAILCLYTISEGTAIVPSSTTL